APAHRGDEGRTAGGYDARRSRKEPLETQHIHRASRGADHDQQSLSDRALRQSVQLADSLRAGAGGLGRGEVDSGTLNRDFQTMTRTTLTQNEIAVASAPLEKALIPFMRR